MNELSSAGPRTEPADVRLRSLRAEAERARAVARAKLSEIRSERAAAVTDDEHDPEGSTLTYEWSLAQAELVAAESSLDQLDAALARVAAGTYGVCVECGRRITQDRLDARPAADTCIDCARKHARRTR